MSYGLLSSLGLAACLAVASHPALAEAASASPGQAQARSDASAPQAAAETPALVPEAAAGMIVYIDPVTGALLSGPAPGAVSLQISPQEQNALRTSDQGLVAQANPIPGGGVKLDLQGRFQSPLLMTIDANGNVVMHHLGETSEPTNNN
jgi:hypothetical protein